MAHNGVDGASRLTEHSSRRGLPSGCCSRKICEGLGKAGNNPNPDLVWATPTPTLTEEVRGHSEGCWGMTRTLVEFAREDGGGWLGLSSPSSVRVPGRV
jgi:hypothetical protein